MDRTIGAFMVALPIVSLCACSQWDGHATNKSADPAVAATTATPATHTVATVLVTTLAAVPGHTIAETDGFNCRFFLWGGHGNYADEFQRALNAFRVAAASQFAVVCHYV